MQTAKEAREARRQRILARGSDRLAYITGDKSKQHSLKASPVSLPQGASSITAQTSEFRSGHNETQIVDDFEQHEPDLKPAEACAEPSGITPILFSSRQPSEEPTAAASLAAFTSSDLSQTRKVSKKSNTTYVKTIIQSIEASEGLRALAAVLVAILVVMHSVLSGCRHPWGDVLGVVLPRWPLRLVWITDLTLVIGAYVIHPRNKSPQKALDSSPPAEGLDGSFNKIFKALDVVGNFEDFLNLGLLCKKVVGALSLDCSLYAVTLICGFSICDYLSSRCRGC